MAAFLLLTDEAFAVAIAHYRDNAGEPNGTGTSSAPAWRLGYLAGAHCGRIFSATKYRTLVAGFHPVPVVHRVAGAVLRTRADVVAALVAALSRWRPRLPYKLGLIPPRYLWHWRGMLAWRLAK